MASNRVRAEVAGLLLAVVLASAAQLDGQDKGDDELHELIASVEPSVVTIEVPGIGAGSGFVVDADGIIATCYHVIEGAKTAVVKFQDGSSADVVGFLTVSPGKDIALLRIKPQRKLVALRIARDRPSKGQTVLAFGAPIGLAGTVSNGIISALRDGFEISGSMKELYAALGYDMEANWLQTTAPISHGNSGGPLVNKDGDAIGINTWFRPDGQNLNFAISTVYVHRMLEDARESLHPFAELPKPKGVRGAAGQDARQDAGLATRNYWAELANSKQSLKRYDEARVAGSIPFGYDTALRRHAERVKSIWTKGVDFSLVEVAILEAQNAERLVTAISERDAEAFASERAIRVRINEAYDFLRISLSAKYGIEFPAVTSFEAQGGAPRRRGAPLSEAELAAKAEATLKRAKELLARGYDGAALGQLSELIADHPQTSAAKEAVELFGPAVVKFAKEGKFITKRELERILVLLRQVTEKCPGTVAAKEAAELTEKVSFRIRSDQGANRLHYVKKLIAIGNVVTTPGLLKELIEKYSDTPAAEEAKKILEKLEADK